MIDRMGRRRALLGLSAIAIGAMTILAPAAALAQDLGGTSVPDLGDTADSTTGTVDSTTGIVDSTTGTIDTTTDTVTQPVKDTVDSTTDTTSGSLDDTVDSTTGTVGTVAPVSDTTKTIEDTTKSTTDSVSGTVSGTKDTTDSLGGTVLNPDLTIVNPLSKDVDGDGKVSKKERTAAAEQTTAKMKAALAAERSEKIAAKAKDASLTKLERNRRTQGLAPVSAVAPPKDTFLTQLADAAVEATKKLAFPLGLALMVGAFLVVQGRIDRKDAKLALAPIDSEQDLLSFQ